MIERLSTSHSGPVLIVSATSAQQFSVLIDLITRSLAETSRRVYAHTYRQWCAYTDRNDLDYFDLSFENILDFLNQSDYRPRHPPVLENTYAALAGLAGGSR